MTVDIATQNVTVTREPLLPPDTAPEFQRYGYRITKTHGDRSVTEVLLTRRELGKVVAEGAEFLFLDWPAEQPEAKQ